MASVVDGGCVCVCVLTTTLPLRLYFCLSEGQPGLFVELPGWH